MPTLTEQAKETPKRTIHKITPQIVELALAWAKDEISIGQVKKVLKVSENNKAYSILARALKEKIRKIDKNPFLPIKPIDQKQASFQGKNPHMVFSKDAVEKAEPLILDKPIPPVEVVVPPKVVTQTNDKKQPEDSNSNPDTAPSRY